MVTLASNQRINVRVLVMGRHFLYLPLYIAQADIAEVGKAPYFGMVPERYAIEIKPPERKEDRTDAGVFDALMDARLGSSDIMFAACDPNVLLARPADDARMIASLVSSSAFWAVNHEDRAIQLVSDLNQFDRIICYGEKTTSNLIARRIARGRTDKLIKVEPLDEIGELEKEGPGALAISPELLTIAGLPHAPLKRGERRLKMVLNLCTCKEFSNVLTTALFTRAEVVDRHPELVSGLLAALQCSLVAIHSGNPKVVECVKHIYRDAYHREEALRMARESNVFPETIQVRPDRWQRACEFSYISHAIAENRQKKELNKTEALYVEELYRRSVCDGDVARIVSESIGRGFTADFDGRQQEPIDAAEQVSSWRRVLSATGLLMIGAGMAQPLSAGCSIGSFVTAGSWLAMLCVGWWTSALARYRKHSAKYVGHWIVLAITWWAIHELIVATTIGDASFIRGVTPNPLAASAIFTVGFAFLVGSVKRSNSRRRGAGSGLRSDNDR